MKTYSGIQFYHHAVNEAFDFRLMLKLFLLNISVDCPLVLIFFGFIVSPLIVNILLLMLTFSPVVDLRFSY